MFKLNRSSKKMKRILNLTENRLVELNAELIDVTHTKNDKV